jgi:hypothetical protein
MPDSNLLRAHYDAFSRLWDAKDDEAEALDRQRKALPPITPDETMLIFTLMRRSKAGAFAVLGSGGNLNTRLKAMASLIGVSDTISDEAEPLQAMAEKWAYDETSH